MPQQDIASATTYPAHAGLDDVRPPDRSSMASAVSWGAIFSGAAAAAALSLVLLILGTGLGLSSASPWTGEGVSGTTLGISTIAWLAATQLIASGLGGYLAGRLRTKWVAVHSDEIYFRDTAHGFLAWAVASLATAALLGSAIGSIAGTGARAGAAIAGTAVTAASTAGAAAMTGTTNGGSTRVADGSSRTSGVLASLSPGSYLLDSLFRRAMPAADSAGSSSTSPTSATPSGYQMQSRDASGGAAAPTAEVAGILANALRTGSLSEEDLRYTAQLVSRSSGLGEKDAEKRVSDTFTHIQAGISEAKAEARAIADKARKATAYAALWIFASLLIGAFSASLMATWGGRRRDL